MTRAEFPKRKPRAIFSNVYQKHRILRVRKYRFKLYNRLVQCDTDLLLFRDIVLNAHEVGWCSRFVQDWGDDLKRVIPRPILSAVGDLFPPLDA